jgi:hypothetical protein
MSFLNRQEASETVCRHVRYWLAEEEAETHSEQWLL